MSSDASVAFRMWLSSFVRPVLRKRGFTRKGSTFHLRAAEGWGVVDFQKSQFGSSGQVRFTVNLGVTLDRLSVARGDDPDRKPAEHRCAWRCRLGTILERGDDRWWTVDTGTDLRALAAEVLPPIVDRGLPLIDERLSPSGFLEALARPPKVGQVAGFTDAQVAELLSGGR
jgi:hypothetical protein